MDMGAYLDRRKGTSSSSFSFFRVDSFSKSKSPSKVPDVDDMETTIVDRPKGKSWLARLFGSSSVEEDLPDDVREEVEHLEEDIEELDHEVEDLEHQREGLFSRLFSLLRMRKPREPEDVDPEMVASAMGNHTRNEALISDTRVVLKDLHKWLGKLPPEQIDAFKRSPDFQRYKELLDQYGLIR